MRGLGEGSATAAYGEGGSGGGGGGSLGGGRSRLLRDCGLRFLLALGTGRGFGGPGGAGQGFGRGVFVSIILNAMRLAPIEANTVRAKQPQRRGATGEERSCGGGCVTVGVGVSFTRVGWMGCWTVGTSSSHCKRANAAAGATLVQRRWRGEDFEFASNMVDEEKMGKGQPFRPIRRLRLTRSTSLDATTRALSLFGTMSNQYLNTITENASRLGMRLQESFSEHTRDLTIQRTIYSDADDKFKDIRRQLDSNSDREKLDAMKRLVAVRRPRLPPVDPLTVPSSSQKAATSRNTLPRSSRMSPPRTSRSASSSTSTSSATPSRSQTSPSSPSTPSRRTSPTAAPSSAQWPSASSAESRSP